MTGQPPPAGDLDAEFAAIEAGIDGLASGGTDRPELEARVARLCDAVVARPPAQAKALLPALEALIARLDAAATEIQARGDRSDSPAPTRSARAAAAAYGAGRNRGRRGF